MRKALNPTAISFLALLVFSNWPVYAMEYWESFDGPGGGDVRCILPHPDLEGVVYVGIGAHDAHESFGSGGGVFYSLDAGETWNRAGLQGVDVAGLTVASGRIWAATAGAGVFSAEDVAGPWREENFGLECLEARSLLSSDTHLLLGTTEGCYRRDVSQWLWHPASEAQNRTFYALAWSPVLPSLVLAATDSFVWRSEDLGEHWVFSGTGMDQPSARSVTFGSDTRCWAGTFDRWNGEGTVYCSEDLGATWNVSYALPSSRDAVWCLAVHPSDSDMVVVGTGALSSWKAELYGTFDGGETWEQLYYASALSYGSIRAVAFLPQLSGHILAGVESAGGILRSTDGGDTWLRSVAGLDASNVYSLEIPEQGAETIIAGKGKATMLSIWSDTDQAWTDLDSMCPSAFYRDIVVWPEQPDRILSAAWNDAYLTTDGGKTWASQGLGDRNVVADLSPADPEVVYLGGRSGLFISHDGADSWSSADTTVGTYVTALAVNPFDGAQALVSAQDWLFRTTDAGTSWEQLHMLRCLSLAYHQQDPSIVYAGTEDQGVYVSTNGGESFEQVVHGLGDSTVNAIVSDPSDPGIIWAGTTGGVYKTLNAGGQWIPDNIGLGNQHVLALEVDDASRRIFVSSYGGGVRWSSIEHTGVSPGSDPVAIARYLDLVVSPVPCRSTATIHLGIPLGISDLSDQLLDLSVYSLDGRLVKQTMQPFAARVQLGLEETPSGIYWISATANGLHGSALISLVR